MERSEKSERSSFFIPKGALTHHLTVGQMVVLPAEVVRSFSGGQQTRRNSSCLHRSAHLLLSQITEIITLFQFCTELYRRPQIKSVSQLLSKCALSALHLPPTFFFRKRNKNRLHDAGRKD